MAKKTLELGQLMKSLSLSQVSMLHALNGDPKFKDFISVILHVRLLDQLKIIGLASDMNSVDEAVKCTSKQNFYRGRINFGVLLRGLMVNAESELEKREAKANA